MEPHSLNDSHTPKKGMSVMFGSRDDERFTGASVSDAPPENPVLEVG